MSEGLPKTQGEDVDANNNAGGSEWDILSDMPDFSDFNDDDTEWDFDSSKDEKEPRAIRYSSQSCRLRGSWRH